MAMDLTAQKDTPHRDDDGGLEVALNELSEGEIDDLLARLRAIQAGALNSGVEPSLKP